jgi:uncharacterized protein (TIGR00725 family)
MGRAGEVVRRRVVTVIGSGGAIADELARRVEAVGGWIAGRGCHLLTGGGPGVMAAASRGFCSVERGGVAIGVLPAGGAEGAYPNPWVELPIFTHLAGDDPRGVGSRNPINVLSADVLVAFAGREGTRAELELAAATPKLRGAIVACLTADERVGGLGVGEVGRLGVAVAADVEGTIVLLARLLPPSSGGVPSSG